jgi:hypothetical protein
VLARFGGCHGGNYTGEKINLWNENDVSGDARFDFEKTHTLRSIWCAQHGRNYCENILKLDETR